MRTIKMGESVTIEIKVSHYMPEDHGTHVDFIAPWARALEAESNAAFRVIVHSGTSAFGVLNNQYAQVSSGAVDVAHCVASLPPDRFPRTSIIGMPFLATGAGEATRMLWHLFPRYLHEEYNGLHVLALHADSGGLLHTREGPIRRLEDLAGLRIRTPNAVIGDALTQLGAVPVPLAPREIKAALLSGIIDGAAMAWDVLDYSHSADLLRYHLNMKLYVSPLYFVMNKARYHRLEPALRATVDSVSGERLVTRFDSWWETWERPGIDAAQQRGNSITRLDDCEVNRWRNAVKPTIARRLQRLEEQGVANASEIYERAIEISQTKGSATL